MSKPCERYVKCFNDHGHCLYLIRYSDCAMDGLDFKPR